MIDDRQPIIGCRFVKDSKTLDKGYKMKSFVDNKITDLENDLPEVSVQLANIFFQNKKSYDSLNDIIVDYVDKEVNGFDDKERLDWVAFNEDAPKYMKLAFEENLIDSNYYDLLEHIRYAQCLWIEDDYLSYFCKEVIELFCLYWLRDNGRGDWESYNKLVDLFDTSLADSPDALVDDIQIKLDNL